MRFITIITAALFSVVGATEEALELENRSMVCPGKDMGDYCNCGSSCGLSECDCADARSSTCCGGNDTPRPTRRPTRRPIGDAQNDTPRPTRRPTPRPTRRPTPRPTPRYTLMPLPTPKPIPAAGAVMCPENEDYCNCGSDCGSSLCACAAGKGCCEGMELAFPRGAIQCQDEYYCDVEGGDCMGNNGRCDCVKAQDRCGGEFLSAQGTVQCPAENGYCDCGKDCNLRNNRRCSCEKAVACCDNRPEPVIPWQAVLCPGYPDSEYCDCSDNCEDMSDWCRCTEAQKCCDEKKPLPEGAVQCPDFAFDEFCDCTDDCKNNSERCDCREGQMCCSGKEIDAPTLSGRAVLCPGESSHEYCDCRTGSSDDCFSNSARNRCDCPLANECCRRSNALEFS